MILSITPAVYQYEKQKGYRVSYSNFIAFCYVEVLLVVLLYRKMIYFLCCFLIVFCLVIWYNSIKVEGVQGSWVE